jgi:hypothetical protein
MFLAGKKLAPFTPKYNEVSIWYGSEPEEALPIRLTHKWLCSCVTSADTSMNALQDDLSFFWGYAFH